MLLTLLAGAAISAPDSGHVAGASLFKNGYAVVVREYPFSGSELVIDELPQPQLGTFWITASSGVQIASVVKTTKEVDAQHEAESLDDILRANIGRALVLGLDRETSVGKAVSGKILSVSGDIVLVQTDHGAVALHRSMIENISSEGGEIVYKTPAKGSKNVLDIKLASPARGSIYTVGLERGLTWAPSYSVDITDLKKLSLVAKATVLDDLANLKDVEVKFVTGFPNMPWLAFLDPFLSGATVDQFNSMLSSVGLDRGPASANGMLMQNAAPRESERDMAAAFTPSNVPGMQAEDLFFYRQPHVTLKTGDRGYFVLLKAESDYEHLYTLDLPNNIQDNVEYRPIPVVTPPDVWHTIKFKNTSGQPLTTAPVTVFQNGEVLGQDTLSYSSPGSDVLVRMSKALDVHADANEEEVSRERASLRLPNDHFFDLVTLKGTIALQNFKDKAVKMKITKEIFGELVSADGSPTVTKTAKGLQDVNPTLRLIWTPEIAAGGKLALTYTYRVYVRTQ